MLPESTYRLQFHAGFTFRDGAAIIPYLHLLGITHVYASPYLKARLGSTHGYDVIDHCSLNSELGTQADYDAFCDALASHGMSQILDTVPNHVGVGTNDNVWWNDVLEHGRASKYAKYFDITWGDDGKLFLPVLGAPLNEVLAKGELKLVREEGRHWLRYYDRRFPLQRQGVLDKGPDGIDDALLAAQHYTLGYWRDASKSINYRRFFDINDLAALAQEHEEVFEATHAFTFKLIFDGRVSGLRIDHPDGLYDPKQYLQRLREKQPGLYVVVEKILAPDEPLPQDWPVNGTTGYDFLNMINGLFVDSRNETAFTKLYNDWTGDDTAFDDLVYAKKKLILETSLASELQMLAKRLDETLAGALREVIACFPVYRTYVTSRGVSESDVTCVDEAIRRAVVRNPQTDVAVFHRIREGVLRKPEFAAKFQQLTSPVMAKGVEDTAFYVFNRFVSLNEVGGEPSHFGVSPDKLHAYFADRQAKWPYAMSALSTHDTKRSEDVRARLNVLSEIPDEWEARVKRWSELNARHRTGNAPDRNEEYLLYQTLLGAWPLEPWSAAEYDAFVARVQAYMLKAMREAKVNTSWTAQNAAHERAVDNFVAAILDETRSGEFLADLRPFRQRVSRLGLLNSLAQTVLRLTAPGVPDTYQGQELWDFSLVDPDNRRPVDYAKRAKLLDEIQSQASLPTLLETIEDGRAKLFVTTRLLRLRREHPGLFSAGEYIPLRLEGERASSAFAFARRYEGRTAIVLVKRLAAGPDDLGAISLRKPDDARCRDVLSGYELVGNDAPVGTILSQVPAAVFMS